MTLIKQLRNWQIEVSFGKISQYSAHAIIIPANEGLKRSNMSFHDEIAEAAGEQVFDELRPVSKKSIDDYLTQKNNLAELGSAHVTSAGDIPQISYIIHGVMFGSKKDTQPSKNLYAGENIITKCVESSLREASFLNGVTKIGIPQLAKGSKYNIDLENSINAIVGGALNFNGRVTNPTIAQIGIVLGTPDSYQSPLITQNIVENVVDESIREFYGYNSSVEIDTIYS